MPDNKFSGATLQNANVILSFQTGVYWMPPELLSTPLKKSNGTKLTAVMWRHRFAAVSKPFGSVTIQFIEINTLFTNTINYQIVLLLLCIHLYIVQ